MFAPHEVEWRLQQAGKNKQGSFYGIAIPYVDARTIQIRLDDVCGPQNWKDSYEILPTGTLCTISLKVEYEWIGKTNGAEQTEVEAFKGGISKAFVRAAVNWGIGRYLYEMPTMWAKIVEVGTNGARQGQTKEKERFSWLPPELPSWAHPKASKQSEPGALPEPAVDPKKEPTKLKNFAPTSSPSQASQNEIEIIKKAEEKLEMEKSVAKKKAPPKKVPNSSGEYICDCGKVMQSNNPRTFIYCPNFQDGKEHSRAVPTP